MAVPLLLLLLYASALWTTTLATGRAAPRSNASQYTGLGFTELPLLLASRWQSSSGFQYCSSACMRRAGAGGGGRRADGVGGCGRGLLHGERPNLGPVLWRALGSNP